MKIPPVILDSSVIAKWFFAEEGSDVCLKIKRDFEENKISIVAPLLLYYEVSNILKTSVKRLRIDKNDALKVYKDFTSLNITLYSSEELMHNTLKAAIKYDISSYDASYVALSFEKNIPFFTADKKLVLKVASPLISYIEDFS